MPKRQIWFYDMQPNLMAKWWLKFLQVYALTRERDTLRREQNKKNDATALLKEKDEIISQVMAEGMSWLNLLAFFLCNSEALQ